MRVKMNDYVKDWEKRKSEIQTLCDEGIVPWMYDMKQREGKNEIPMSQMIAFLMGKRKKEKKKVNFYKKKTNKGQSAGSINEIMPAGKNVQEIKNTSSINHYCSYLAAIIEELMRDCIHSLRTNERKIARL